jgi:hypothetical protein
VFTRTHWRKCPGFSDPFASISMLPGIVPRVGKPSSGLGSIRWFNRRGVGGSVIYREGIMSSTRVFDTRSRSSESKMPSRRTKRAGQSPAAGHGSGASDRYAELMLGSESDRS